MTKNVVKTLLNVISVVSLLRRSLLFFRDYGQNFLLHLYDRGIFNIIIAVSFHGLVSELANF